MFSLLSLDQSPKLAELLSLDLTLLDNLEILRQINQLLVKQLSSEVSALVVDPVYSLEFLSEKSVKSAALIRLEQNREFLPNQVPELFPDFSLEEVKNNYAVAKLTLFYHPKEERALEKKQLLAEIKDYCRILGIAFCLELKIYDPDKFQLNFNQLESKDSRENQEGVNPVNSVENELFSFQTAQLEAVEELRNLADIFVLEYPGDVLSVATLTTQLDSPWLLTSSGKMSYQDFKEIFREAVENGAKGYLLGELLWQEIVDFRQEDSSLDLTAINKYIQGTVRDRLIELNRIASEAHESATA